MKLTSATFYNISLLTSDFYTLVIGILFLDTVTHYLYYIAFTLVVIGLFIFNIFPSYKKGENTNNSDDVESNFETHKEYDGYDRESKIIP
jgi:solute carrier family 35 protein F1/2